MIDYKQIWSSLNEESLKNPSASFRARRIPSDSHHAVFLASDSTKNTRFLYVQIDSSQIINVEALPRYVGLEINTSVMTLGACVNKAFVVFRQLMPNTESIFELVMSDVCDNVIKLTEPNKLENTLQQTLSSWKLFFEKQSDQMLSIQQQKGLFAELYFLSKFLFDKLGAEKSLQSWTASSRTNHDFQLERSAIEVKATAGKQHQKIIISSEKQLDNSGLDKLVLTVLSLNVHSARPEISLSALVDEVYYKLQHSSAARFYFDLKLLKAGYLRKHHRRYEAGFTVTQTDFFEVTTGFPRLINSNLPNGIGDIRYSIMKSACEQFKRDETFFNSIFI